MGGMNDHVTMAGEEKNNGGAGADDDQSTNPGSSSEQRTNLRKGLSERMAARAGFSAPRLDTESIRPADLSQSSGMQSPYLTIPPGLSPTALLDSPVFLSNMLVRYYQLQDGTVMADMCKSMGITPFGTDEYLRFILWEKLKSYCEYFDAGVYYVEPCSCQECFNKPIYEDTVLATRKQIESRNLLEFAPKVVRNSDAMIEVGEASSKTPAPSASAPVVAWTEGSLIITELGFKTLVIFYRMFYFGLCLLFFGVVW